MTRIVIDEQQSPAYGGRSFGDAGPYERITGRAFGELDPQDPHNTIINDIDLAPRNARNRVEYVATFSLWKPVDLAKASGVLIYAVPNRGNRILLPAFSVGGDPGDGFFFKRGDIILYSGWQGDVRRAGRRDDHRAGGQEPRRVEHHRPRPRPVQQHAGRRDDPFAPHGSAPASPGTSRATLTRRASEDGAVVPVAPADWAFADCRTAPFPGTPDPTRLSIKGGFDPAYLYELTYTTKDPPVLGVGLAATRDIVSFFRHAARDDEGAANPLAGGRSRTSSPRGSRRRATSSRRSSTSASTRTSPAASSGTGRTTTSPAASSRSTSASPGRAGRRPSTSPAARACSGGASTGTRPRPPTAGLLDRCRASGTVPKVFETFGSAEFWGLRMSPGLVGTKADRDIPLPTNVRRYYFPGTTHGGGPGGFGTARQGVGPLRTARQPQPAAGDDAGADGRPDRLGRQGHRPAAEPLPAARRGPVGAARSRRHGLPRDPRRPAPGQHVEPLAGL